MRERDRERRKKNRSNYGLFIIECALRMHKTDKNKTKTVN